MSDEEEARGADGEDPIEDADDLLAISGQRHRRPSGVEHVNDLETTRGSSPDPLGMAAGPFKLVGQNAGRGQPPPTRPKGGESVRDKVAQIEKKSGSGKKALKVSQKLGTVRCYSPHEDSFAISLSARSRS